MLISRFDYSSINIHSVNMNIQDHLTQDQSPIKRKYNEDQSTQDQSTQDKTPIKRKCEYLDVNIHKNMSEKRNRIVYTL